ncbi:hypothetical protein [Sphingomicrobium clamense]|uniref:Tetratricopeptide repeat protein n=1 Tax=Sphingomicrobium clamense TaxID=2851013 RepID=A0ABS6V4E8_9SPHN|nr:hypothetical protein [Sphingomicrobium sp. B8]MBW0144067.1 hypothetical protein [Sphingomicrobium sp. B8]
MRRRAPALLFLSLVSASPAAAQDDARSAQTQLDEAAYALSEGRTVQARAMLAEAVRLGASGEPVDRLLADLSFADGRYTQALARATALLRQHPDDIVLLERAGLAALSLGKDDQASAFLARAARLGSQRWRTYNGLGVLADRRADWAAADAAYAQAEALVTPQATLFNNRGWSMLLQGRWEEALGPLTQAFAMEPQNPLYSANLALASMALDNDLPRREDGEGDAQFAARLNDAGVVAAAQGMQRKAIAAFTRAIEARSQYYERAATNLARIEGDK